MKIIDISWPITPGMTAYKNKKVVEFIQTKNFAQDKVRDSIIKIGSHTGTHVDAPSHFLQDGTTIDQILLTTMIGPCKVFDMHDLAVDLVINDRDLERFLIEKDDIVLFKTTNSNLLPNQQFNNEFVYLDGTAADYLIAQQVKTVGIDYLGIERDNPHHPTHIKLMENNITIIEGLCLADVEPGEYMLCCLPLHTIGLEAAPARAVLITD